MRVWLQSHATLSRFSNHFLRLIAVAGCKIAVLLLYLLGTADNLRLACLMGGDLRGGGAAEAGGLQMLADLLAAQAVGVRVLARVALNLWCSVFLALNFVTEFSEPNGELCTVHSSCELLRPDQLVRLQGAVLAIVGPRHVKEHSVRMELWSRIAINGTSGVVLEFRDDPIAGCLRRPAATNACLDVRLQCLDRSSDRLPV